MLNADMSNRPSVALAILREGRTLLGSDYRKSPIILYDGKKNSRETIIGRLEILSAHHKSCSCDGDTNPCSTKDKCIDCTAVNEWAVTALSKRLLRFTSDGDGNIYVQGRGTYASIHVGSTCLTTDNDTWSEKIPVQLGQTIGLAPTQVEGRKRLDLLVLLEEYLQDIHPEEIRRPILAKELPTQEDTSQDSSSPLPGLQSDCPGEEISTRDGNFSKSSAQCAGGGSVSSNPAKRKNERVDAEKEKFSLFLVPLGHDMSSVRRTFLARKAMELGIVVVENVFSSTHILISQQVSTLREISLALDIEEHALRSYIEQNDISCVLPRWIASAKTKSPPEILDIWYGDINKRQDVGRYMSEKAGRNLHFERNKEIAEVFRTLSNLHQSCPLLEMDQWKAYMFRIIAGRLTHLDFEIRNDPQTLNRLRKIPGIGSNSVDKIQEYLETGSLCRIEEFNSDSTRVAMKNMMSIWGVGRKTALDLIRRGFRDISDVRAAIKEGRHFLDRNQLVGVDCYEDILEEMERDEVKTIGDLVNEVVQEIFPHAVVQVMGSYRRQKSTCGDIDVHITHKSFVKKNPHQGLSRIVDLLWERGHLVYHLTFLPGMETGSTVSDYTKSSKHIPKDAWKLSKPVGYMTSKGSHGSSYMGVMRSPKVDGKHRRIDIKFYPWRERAFASLYFTGNGYFNRSMRLWASRKFRYTLNDHGLYSGGTMDRVMEASSEKEVFDRLNLVYKDPHERDSFDAVVSKAGPIEVELSQAEFKEDKNYVWVV